MTAAAGPVPGRCDCGAVTLALPTLPNRMNACPCEYCRRVGARWGYFPQEALRLEGETDIHVRATRSIEFHRCAACGVTTHWQFPDRPAGTRVGVNMMNFDTSLTAAIPVVVDP